MRVVSRFRDFYDGLASLDREPTPVYRRFLTEAKLRVVRRRGRSRVWGADGADDPAAVALAQQLEEAGAPQRWPCGTEHCEIEPFVVAFCGRAHVGFQTVDGAAWTFAEALRAARARPHFTSELDEADLDERLRATPRHVEALFGLIDRLGAAPYLALDAPVFLLRGLGDQDRLGCIVRNPELGPIGFAARIDPWTAWQELDRFLGNDLARQNDLPEPLDDELRRDIHGFDDRSFKKDPGGPTRKRKRTRK